MNPNPDCVREDCRFTVSGTFTTCIYFSPIYDKYGNNLNPDGNITAGSVECTTCKQKWSYETQHGVTSYTEQA